MVLSNLLVTVVGLLFAPDSPVEGDGPPPAAADETPAAAEQEPAPTPTPRPAPPPPEPPSAPALKPTAQPSSLSASLAKGYGVALSAERALPVVATYIQEASLSTPVVFGPTTSGGERTTMGSVPRLAVDFRINGPTLGLFIALQGITDDDTTTYRRNAFGAGARLGYVFGASRVAIWPRIGGAVLNGENLTVTFEVPIALFLANHLAFTIGPTIDHTLQGNALTRLALDTGLLVTF